MTSLDRLRPLLSRLRALLLGVMAAIVLSVAGVPCLLGGGLGSVALQGEEVEESGVDAEETADEIVARIGGRLRESGRRGRAPREPLEERAVRPPVRALQRPRRLRRARPLTRGFLRAEALPLLLCRLHC